jgi:DNA-binding transcriptional MerR regulator
MDQTTLLTIGQLAQRFGLKTSAIRYYERIGVLPEPERHSGQRRYGADAIKRLEVLDIAKRAGFSLDEARVLLHGPTRGPRRSSPYANSPPASCPKWSRSSHARKRCASGC